MSDTDSFINEVTEQVRNDQLFGYLKRYGWIAIAAILLIVGGAAYNEWQKTQTAAKAQAAGDALLDALSQDESADRAQALADVTLEGPTAAVLGLLQAASLQETGDGVAAAEVLRAMAANPDVPEIYRDVATFKALLLDDSDPDARRTSLEALASPGLPFSLLAQEQLALMDVADGNTEAAITTLRAIGEDAAVSRGLRERAQTLMIALGAEPEPVASQ